MTVAWSDGLGKAIRDYFDAMGLTRDNHKARSTSLVYRLHR